MYVPFDRSLQDIIRKGGLPHNYNGRNIWFKVKYVSLYISLNLGSVRFCCVSRGPHRDTC